MKQFGHVLDSIYSITIVVERSIRILLDYHCIGQLNNPPDLKKKKATII